MKSTYLFVLILVLVVAAGAVYLFFRTPTQEPVACTQEALQCPDGSFVSRTGPQCAFASCPKMEFVEGVLEQKTEGFRLVLNSPGENVQEVAYALPLRIQATSTAQDLVNNLVNKKVRAYGTFAEGNTLIADHLEALSPEQADPTLGTVRVGQTTFINGVRVTLNAVAQDSRCPANVVCIQAGSVTVNVTLQSNTDKETRDIVSSQPPVAFDSYLISIGEITPAQVSGLDIRPGDYMLTFKVISH